MEHFSQENTLPRTKVILMHETIRITIVSFDWILPFYVVAIEIILLDDSYGEIYGAVKCQPQEVYT